MIKNLVVFALLSVLCFVGYSASRQSVATINGRPMDKEELKKSLYRHTGGRIIDSTSLHGRIVFVNCQNLVSAIQLQQNADFFMKKYRIRTEVKAGSFDWPTPVLEGNASLYVVDNMQLPCILIAPENRWALVNVAPLHTGAGNTNSFLFARVQKELTRAFAMLAGACASTYPGTIMSCVTKPEQLDEFIDTHIPVDVVGRFEKYLAGYGVRPGVETTYRKAVIAGWAPAPTNDVQRAIWDKVHALPTAPLTIKPETKKVKE